MNQSGEDLATLLSDPAFVERTVNSDAFIDWNLELAISGISLPPAQAARMFLRRYPHHITELRCPSLPDLWQSFVKSDWLRNNELEPRRAGFSVLRDMLVQQSDPTDTQTLWACGVPSPSQPNAICGQVFRRWDRAITHIRARHLNHRPFPCGGRCGVPTWYVAPCLPAYNSNASKLSYSERRFTSQENVHQHCNQQVE